MGALANSISRAARRFLAAIVPAAAALGFCLAVAATAAAAEAPREVSVEDLQSLVAAIEDDDERQAFVARLKALIATRKGAAGEPVESVGARFIAALSERVRQSSRQVVAAAETLSDLPALLGWLRTQAADSRAQAAWLRLLIKLAAALAAGLLAERLAAILLTRPRGAVEGREADSLLVRVPFVLLRGILDAVPVAAFAAAAYAVLPLLQPGPRVYVVTLTVIYAYVLARAVLVAARLVLVPAVPSLRLLPMGGETANYLFIWTRRLVVVGVSGYFLAEAALLLGLPAGGYAGLLRMVGLLVGLMGVLFLLQNREVVAHWLRGEGGEGRVFGLGALRQRFADIWHVLAIIYVAGVYGVWVLGIEGGFEFLLRATLASLVILAVARLAAVGLRRSVERGFALRSEVKARFPNLEGRANLYLPALHVVLRAVIYVIAALALLQAWGIDAFAWLDSPFGRRLTQSAFSIAAIVVIALLVWEAVSASIERYLSTTDADGNLVERSARIRTLLPLARNAVLLVLAVMVTLIVLSELGINIAPLLAGAGVVGLAIGFGAQTLVKDVITGLFILIEDTIVVGDYIEVANHAGTVEALSIRTLRLRDPAGRVHTVPFSDVGAVLNYTKEFSYAVLDIGVGYRENVDEVMAVVEGIGGEMMKDPELAAHMLEPLEVQGLNSFDDSAVVIRARIKTRPGMQWAVRRAFNRRMKNRFDELGIEIPFPHTTIYFGEDKQGSAPPVRVFTEPTDAGRQMAAEAEARQGDTARAREPRLKGREVAAGGPEEGGE